MPDTKSDEKDRQHSQEKAADPKPIADNLSDSDLEGVSGGLAEVKNNICGSGC